jgi:DNA recombination protein RmuC
MEENAAIIAKLANDLYERVGNVVDSVFTMGNGLKTALTAYDAMVGSMQSRLLVTMRTLKDMGVVQENEPMKNINVIGIVPREIKAPETEIKGEIEG